MKKKAIEKIPFMTLKKVCRKKCVKYVTVTDIKDIGNEEHLFLEVYRNYSNTRFIPIVRIVLTKKDFGNYYPDSGEWSRQKIETDHYYNNGLLWTDQEDCRLTKKELAEISILEKAEDIKKIKKMCGKEDEWREPEWWGRIYNREDAIVTEERLRATNRRYERRQQALNDRIANTPVLDKAKLIAEASQRYISHKHYLYYKKHGSFATIACSACGAVTDGRWRMGVSYESQFQRWIEEPREKYIGACSMCGAAGEYKCQGKTKGEQTYLSYVYLGQKYKETGMVFSYIEIAKKWRLYLRWTDNGEEMIGAGEEVSCEEIARGYLEEGRTTAQIDYHKHNPYDGKNFWDDCNLYGMNNIQVRTAPIMPDTYQQMQGTIFQYSGLKEYAAAAGEINPIDYLERYIHTPQIEMLSKLGLIGVVDELARCHYGIVYDQKADRPDKFLGIRKEHFKLLMKHKGNIDMLRIMQTEKRVGENWTDEQILHLAEAGVSAEDVCRITPYMSLQQFLNRIEKYAGCKYETGCATAPEMIKTVGRTYIDYLQMRLNRGYDLHNTVYQFPRNLQRAHDQMVAESVAEKENDRLREVREKFPKIRKNYRKLRKKYFYEDDKYQIRPARSAEEIVMEGRTLHHCVGGNYYLGEHNKGEAYILFLRNADQKEIPYVTVEINAENNKIKQWHGANDKKPDEKNISKWLSSYIKWLEGASKTSGIRKNKEMAENLLVAAI